MTLLSRAQLLKKEKLEIAKVDLGNGEFVYVRQMTGRERDNFEGSLLKKVTKGNEITYESSLVDFRAKLAVNTLCDKDGKSLLRPDDYETLSTNISAAKLAHIVDEAQKLNKISEEDKEDMVKNSDGGQAADSSSDSAKK